MNMYKLILTGALLALLITPASAENRRKWMSLACGLWMTDDGQAHVKTAQSYWRGLSTPEAAEADAIAKCEKRGLDDTLSSAAKPDERCEAHFYIGEWHMLQNNRDEAAKALQVAKDTCPKNFVEYTAAVAELKRLGDAAKVPEPAATKTSGASQEMELGFWNSVKDSDDPAMLQAYLDQFPNGTFVSIAKIKIEKLKKTP